MATGTPLTCERLRPRWGISASRMRKDELEREIRRFLRTGEVRSPRPQREPKGRPDSELGLYADLPVARYVNDPATKAFILSQCRRIDPNFRPQSGTRYPLNRWREEQLASGKNITYGDLAKKFIEINREKTGPLRTEHGRYNNFVSDFRAANKSADHAEVVAAWNELKGLDLPKTYAAWQDYKRKGRGSTELRRARRP